MENNTLDFEGKVLEVRKAIAKLSPSFCEQQAIAFAALHHFELKQRLAEMDKHQPKADKTMIEGFKLADGEPITREFTIMIQQEVDKLKGAVPKATEWTAKDGESKIIMKHVKKPKGKKRRGMATGVTA